MTDNFVDVKGRVKYIEPTNVKFLPGGGHEIMKTNTEMFNPLEDYCISIDLKVVIPNRKACGLGDSTGEDKIMNFSSTNGTISFLHGTSGVLTTNFTDVDVLNPTTNTAECFGIESINISYNSWLAPEVNIRFIDVKGSSVLLPEEYSYQTGTGQGSLYRALFSFPYPLFILKVKGFYGKGATYYLAPSNTSIELDASSGNFILNTTFIGKMFRIYADIPMTYICVAPYMTNGEEYWNTQVKKGVFKFKNRSGTETEMMKFPELLEKVADMATDHEKKVASARGEQITKDYDTRISDIRHIKSISPDSLEKWYEDKESEIACLLTVDPGLDSEKKVSEKIGDFISAVSAYDETYHTQLLCQVDYLTKYTELPNKKGRANITTITCTADRKNHVARRDREEYSEYFGPSGNTKTQEFLNDFAATKSNVNIFYAYIFKTPKDGVTVKQFIEEKLESELRETEKLRQQEIETFRELENVLIERSLGFTPSIENMYNLAFAHMDTFMHCFYEHLKVIKSKIEGPNPSADRLVSAFDCGNDLNIYETVLPPYTSFYEKSKQSSTQSPNVEIWPEDIGKGYALDEVNFVKDLLSATKLYAKEYADAEEYYKQQTERLERAEAENKRRLTEGVGGSEFLNGAPNTSIASFIPVTTYDFVNKDRMDNPYRFLLSTQYDYSQMETAIFGTFALRAIYYLSTNGDGRKDGDAFGRIEAFNFMKGVGEDFLENKAFKVFIHTYADGKKDKKEAREMLKSIVSPAEENKSPYAFGTKQLIKDYNGRYGYSLEKEGPSSYPLGSVSPMKLKNDLGSGETMNSDLFYVKETEETVPTNKSFHVFDARDYLSQIFNNVRTMASEIKDETDGKTKIKNAILKEFENNMDSTVAKDDTSFPKNIIMKKEGDKYESVNSWQSIATVINSSTDDLEQVYVQYPTVINENKTDSLFDEQIYKMQESAASKAYLFLSALPMKHYRKAENQKCGIPIETRNGVELRSVLLREGSFYWRESEIAASGKDPILTGGKYKEAAAHETYMAGTNKNDDGKNYETLYPLPSDSKKTYIVWSRPKGCTPSRVEVLKKLFLDWVETEFKAIEPIISSPSMYCNGKFQEGFDINRIKTEDSGHTNAYAMKKFMNRMFFSVSTVLDYYDGRNDSDVKFLAPSNSLMNAFRGFIEGLTSIYKEDAKKSDEEIDMEINIKKVDDPFNNKDLRLSTYNTLKSLYDQWLCAPYKGENTWKFGDENSDFSNFVYIDSFYRKIGKDLFVNLTKVIEWISSCIPTNNLETSEGIMRYTGRSLYEYLTDIAQNVGGVLYSFPQRIGGIRDDYLADMFRAMPYNSDWDTDEASFVFIYSYKPSEHIGADQYEDDGIQLDDTEQVESIMGGDGYEIPAFGVTYAKQNQSFFKNITLTTENAGVTEASIAATLAIASKGSEGARETTLFGQDLYRVRTAYAYQCEFDMMGCVQVMPLMYFQLNNVPFWRGAYMILSVTHSITAGDMTTHVKGVRINKNALPFTDGTSITDKVVEGNGSNAGTGSAGGSLPTVLGAAYGLHENNIAGDKNFNIPDTEDFVKENITEQKPIICLTPAHGPKTGKSAEWEWSSTLIDDFIIPKLKKLNFYDGTSFSDNIQRCNKGGSHTDTGYSTIETQRLIKKYGSKKVISVVPHWNGNYSYYFAVYDGYKYCEDREHDRNCRVTIEREDSRKFAGIVREEAMKMVDRANNGEFLHQPSGMTRSVKDIMQLVEGKNTDGATKLDCACVLTENWFPNYSSHFTRKADKTMDYSYAIQRYVGDRSQLDSKRDKWAATEENGRYCIGEGWLFDKEGLNAVSDMHVEAIRRYIDSLSK